MATSGTVYQTQPCQLHVNAKWTPILFANLPFNDIWKLSNKITPKKKAFPKLTKKNFPLRGIPIGKPFLAILRFKNHLRLLQTFEQTIEQPQEGTFPFAAIFVYLHYRAVRRLNTRKPINQSDKSPLCWPNHQPSREGGNEVTAPM